MSSIDLYQEEIKTEVEQKIWKILVVDDDEAVHQVTELVLKDLIFEGKRTQLYFANNIPIAKSILQQHKDICVIFLDVVMEEDNSGLQLVHYVRNELKNHIIRIILRTGQPGCAPEQEIINEYDINDYREKTELTSKKLKTVLISALRSYRDLIKSEEEKKEIQTEANRTIVETEDFLRIVTDALPVLISFIRDDLTIKFSNKAYCSWFAKREEDFKNMSIKSLLSEESYSTFIKNWQMAIKGQSVNFDMVIEHTALGERNTNVILVPHHIKQNISGCFSIIFDITERKQVELNLQYLATHDILTGLYNRIYFDSYIDQAIITAHESESLFAILFIDLNDFKKINDNLGHNIGDLLLIEITKRLQKIINYGNLIARLGGDEFVVILEHIQEKSEIDKIAQEIYNILEYEFLIEGYKIYSSASIGISIYPHDGNNKQTLLKNADFAMYAAKRMHERGYKYFNPKLLEAILHETDIKKHLEEALKNNSFELYYQPIVDIYDNEFTAVEALIRWHHPDKGLLLPDDFIEAIEKTNMMRPIGYWVIREACKHITKIHTNGLPLLKISINLSANQLLDHQLPDKIESILQEMNLKGSYLILELTEHVLLKNYNVSLPILQRIKKLGIAIAIDDFGIGFSTYNYIKELPIDYVKIDKSFIASLNENNFKSEAIIASICKLMRHLNISVIAEGIEIAQQLEFIKECGCHSIQGFLLAKPMSFSQLQDFIKLPIRVPLGKSKD